MTQMTLEQIKQLIFFAAPNQETLDRMLAFLDANNNLIAAQERLIDAYKDNIKKQKSLIQTLSERNQ